MALIYLKFIKQGGGILEKRYEGRKRFSRTREEYIAFYKEQLQDKIAEIDVERETYKKKIVNRLIVGSIIVIVLFFFVLYDERSFESEEAYMKWVIYFPIFIGVMGYNAVSWMKAKEKIEAKVKVYVIDKLVRFMNPNFTYDPDGYVPQKDFNDTLVFRNKADVYLGDDLIDGYVYDEKEQARTNVAFSEIVAMNKEKSYTTKGKKIKPVGTYVYGLFFKVDFNKDFGRSITIVKPRCRMKKRKYRKKLAVYGGKKSSMQEVHLENPDFMKQFIVHSNDQILARVIFQADTMENLLTFVNYKPDLVSGKKAKRRKRKHRIPYFTLRRNQIYVVYHTKSNHFNVNIFEKLSIDTVYTYFQDINRVLRLIDDLNLNLDLYKK